MKIVIQRVRQASVHVGPDCVGSISKGMLVLLGIGQNDSEADADYLIQKILNIRIFDDTDGKMNLSALDIQAEFLIVSQFTLYGNCVKGRRPSFDQAAAPAQAESLYNYFIQALKTNPLKVETGRFAAMMDVSLVNDGPVTLIMEGKP